MNNRGAAEHTAVKLPEPSASKDANNRTRTRGQPGRPGRSVGLAVTSMSAGAQPAMATARASSATRARPAVAFRAAAQGCPATARPTPAPLHWPTRADISFFRCRVGGMGKISSAMPQALSFPRNHAEAPCPLRRARRRCRHVQPHVARLAAARETAAMTHLRPGSVTALSRHALRARLAHGLGLHYVTVADACARAANTRQQTSAFHIGPWFGRCHAQPLNGTHPNACLR
jgi:hypothetical protein